MSADPVRQLAQANPVPNLTAAWTADVEAARNAVDNLTRLLASIHRTANVLDKQHELKVSADLGPVGNAAMAAWQTLEAHKTDHAARTFELPR